MTGAGSGIGRETARYFDDQPDPAQARQFAVSIHPLGRLGQPLDIADAFVYLASGEERWVTGTALVVDGGLTEGSGVD
ncbi:MAG: SDR family oxidoreductase [Solirubrobacteraceae bacterium]